MWAYGQVLSGVKQVGLLVQLQLTVELFDLSVDLGDVLGDKPLHVCRRSV